MLHVKLVVDSSRRSSLLCHLKIDDTLFFLDSKAMRFLQPEHIKHCNIIIFHSFFFPFHITSLSAESYLDFFFGQVECFIFISYTNRSCSGKTRDLFKVDRMKQQNERSGDGKPRFFMPNHIRFSLSPASSIVRRPASQTNGCIRCWSCFCAELHFIITIVRAFVYTVCLMHECIENCSNTKDSDVDCMCKKKVNAATELDFLPQRAHLHSMRGWSNGDVVESIVSLMLKSVQILVNKKQLENSLTWAHPAWASSKNRINEMCLTVNK